MVNNSEFSLNVIQNHLRNSTAATKLVSAISVLSQITPDPYRKLAIAKNPRVSVYTLQLPVDQRSQGQLVTYHLDRFDQHLIPIFNISMIYTLCVSFAELHLYQLRTLIRILGRGLIEQAHKPPKLDVLSGGIVVVSDHQIDSGINILREPQPFLDGPGVAANNILEAVCNKACDLYEGQVDGNLQVQEVQAHHSSITRSRIAMNSRSNQG